MAEEHGCQAQEGHILCANNCGFFGSSATLDLCSKCYRDFRLKEDQDALAKAALDSTSPRPQPNPSVPGLGLGTSPGPSTTSARLKLSTSTEVDRAPANKDSSASFANARSGPESGPMITPPAQPGRCLTCRKRVGLTGFKCRCGLVFCGSHRYPEQHGCTYDYKTAGKSEIAKANPVIKATKLDKI